MPGSALGRTSLGRKRMPRYAVVLWVVSNVYVCQLLSRQGLGADGSAQLAVLAGEFPTGAPSPRLFPALPPSRPQKVRDQFYIICEGHNLTPPIPNFAVRPRCRERGACCVAPSFDSAAAGTMADGDARTSGAPRSARRQLLPSPMSLALLTRLALASPATPLLPRRT